MSETFWARLTPEQQKIMLDLWAKNIPTYRSNAAAAQTKARKALEEHGVTFTDPSRDRHFREAPICKVMAGGCPRAHWIKGREAIARDRAPDGRGHRRQSLK